MPHRGSNPLDRAAAFCKRVDLRVPVLLARWPGPAHPATSVAVMRAGGMDACGALLMQPREIEEWTGEVRANAEGPFQINLCISERPPARD